MLGALFPSALPDMRRFIPFIALLILGLPANGQQLDMDLFGPMKPRNIGPAGMSGRVTAIDAVVSNPDVIYAAIELDRKTGGVFISYNRGKSWSKQSNAVSGATGPHYYQELYASPHKEGRLYLMDNTMQISEDHGKTFTRINKGQKHSDNHSINFRKDDPDYLLVGTDGVNKMSKSLQNDIPITCEPNDMFGRVLSIPDDALVIDMRQFPYRPFS